MQLVTRSLRACPSQRARCKDDPVSIAILMGLSIKLVVAAGGRTDARRQLAEPVSKRFRALLGAWMTGPV